MLKESTLILNIRNIKIMKKNISNLLKKLKMNIYLHFHFIEILKDKDIDYSKDKVKFLTPDDSFDDC
jgi:DNA-dependent RNA polymerase auxiliary subunit epsilon